MILEELANTVRSLLAARVRRSYVQALFLIIQTITQKIDMPLT